MPARNSAASARGDAPGQNRQARPRLINLFPSHPISLWWHIRRQAEMYDVLKWKCILNAGIWGSSCNVTRVQREKVQGLQRPVPNVGGEKEIQSRNGNLCFFFLQVLVDTNHCLLASLDVSHPALERVRTVSQEQGLHTKVYLHLTRWWWY